MPVALAKALTASGKEYAETEIEYEGKKIKVLCTPYSDGISKLEKHAQQINSEESTSEQQAQEEEQLMADDTQEGDGNASTNDTDRLDMHSSDSGTGSDSSSDRSSVHDGMVVDADDVELINSLMHNVSLAYHSHGFQEDVLSPTEIGSAAKAVMSPGPFGTDVAVYVEGTEAGGSIGTSSEDQVMRSPMKDVGSGSDLEDAAAGAAGGKRPHQEHTTGFTPAKTKAKQGHKIELGGQAAAGAGAAGGWPARNKPKKQSSDYDFSGYTTGRPVEEPSASAGDPGNLQVTGTESTKVAGKVKKKAARSIGKDWQGQGQN